MVPYLTKKIATVGMEKGAPETFHDVASAIDLFEASVKDIKPKKGKKKGPSKSTSSLIEDAMAPIKEKLAEKRGSISFNKLTPEQLAKYERSQKAVKELRNRLMSEASKMFRKEGKGKTSKKKSRGKAEKDKSTSTP